MSCFVDWCGVPWSSTVRMTLSISMLFYTFPRTQRTLVLNHLRTFFSNNRSLTKSHAWAVRSRSSLCKSSDQIGFVLLSWEELLGRWMTPCGRVRRRPRQPLAKHREACDGSLKPDIKATDLTWRRKAHQWSRLLDAFRMMEWWLCAVVGHNVFWHMSIVKWSSWANQCVDYLKNLFLCGANKRDSVSSSSELFSTWHWAHSSQQAATCQPHASGNLK